MREDLKKRALLLSLAMVVSSSMAEAAKNKLVDIQFTQAGNEVVANVLLEKAYSDSIKATKSGSYYNIILPDVDKGSISKLSPGGDVESVRVTTLSSSTGSGSYTKIAIKVAPGAVVNAKSSVFSSSSSLNSRRRHDREGRGEGNSAYSEDDYRNLERELNERHPEEGSYSEPEERVSEAVPDFESENFEASVDDSVAVSSSAQESSLNKTPQVLPKDSLPEDHRTEFLYLIISILGVGALVYLLYLNGRDKINTLCGDMDVDFSDDAKEADKKKKQQEKEQEKERKRTEAILAREMSAKKKAPKKRFVVAKNQDKISDETVQEVESSEVDNLEEEPKKVIDLDATIQDEVSSEVLPSQETTNVVEEDDIDDFLASFVDDEDDEENTSTSEDEEASNDSKTVESSTHEEFESENEEATNPIDSLVDDVIATQDLTLTESDFEELQKRLQVDISQDSINSAKSQSSESKVIEEVIAPSAEQKVKVKPRVIDGPIITLEQYDVEHPEYRRKFEEF